MADLSPGDAYAIGVDVGGTKTKACLVRIADGTVLIEKTRAPPSAQGVAMAAETQREAGELTRGAACRVGVCLPELVSNEGEPGSAWNFEWRGLDFRTPLSAFGPVYVDSVT